MTKKVLPVLIGLLCVVTCKTAKEEPNTTGLLERLQALPGITVRETASYEPFSQAFDILVTQPLHHDNPDGETFQQRIFLSHVNESRPTVFVPDGTGISRNRILELTNILNANQIYVAHRFHKGAIPSTRNWNYLTIRQTAEDYHKIVSLFKQIYQGKWVNSSISKGGTETLIHRHFFPADFDATLAYVAPVALKDEDPRIDHFLREEVGTAACRQKIMQFQRRVLEKKDLFIPLVKDLCQESGKQYSLAYELIFEYHVMEYIFIFWQWGPGDCGAIPGDSATVKEMHDHLLQMVGSYDFYSDEQNQLREPSTYENFTQLGYYGYMTDHLQDLLKASLPNPTDKAFGPYGVDMTHDPAPMKKLLAWLQTSGSNIIYLYGENDPWTACAVELTGKTNCLKIVAPGANHGLRIKELPSAQKDRVISTLKKWLGITINE